MAWPTSNWSLVPAERVRVAMIKQGPLLCCPLSLLQHDTAAGPAVGAEQCKVQARAPKVCYNCGFNGSGGDAVKLKVCRRGCRAAWYCNASCQAAHWNQHKTVCPAGSRKAA